MDKQQTPLQKLIEKINVEIANANHLIEHVEPGNRGADVFYLDRLIGLKIKAASLLPEEKQMVIDAFQANKNWEYLKNKGEQYFKDTYL